MNSDEGSYTQGHIMAAKSFCMTPSEYSHFSGAERKQREVMKDNKSSGTLGFVLHAIGSSGTESLEATQHQWSGNVASNICASHQGCAPPRSSNFG